MQSANKDKIQYTSTAWLDAFVARVRRSPPTKIDAKFLESELGVKGSNAKALLRLLGEVGFVDADGRLTERGNALRHRGEPYSRAIKETVHDLYPDLLEKIKSDASYDIGKLHEHIVANTQLGESAIEKAIRTFRWFVEQAGEQMPWLIPSKRKLAVQRKKRPKK